MNENVKVIEKYLSPDKISNIAGWTDEEKKELLIALGGENLLKKEKTMKRDAKTIGMLCQQKLTTILSAQKNNTQKNSKYFDAKEFNELSKKYNEDLSCQKEIYSRFIEEWFKKWDIVNPNHVLPHTQAQDFLYKSWSLLEKIKFSRGMSDIYNYKMKDHALIWKEKDRDYLRLNPEKIDPKILDFLKNHKQQKKYNEFEKLELKKRCLENQEICKSILSSAKPLLLQEDWTQEGYIPTERIVSLYNGEKKRYMTSEHSPIKYAESHLNKYRWDNVRFEIFETREALEKYLREQIKEDWSMNRQYLRFQDALVNFKKDDEDELRAVLQWFQKHSSFTDQEIIKTIQEILAGEKRGLKQKIEALRGKIKKGMEENRKKKDIMDKHFIALRSNNIF